MSRFIRKQAHLTNPDAVTVRQQGSRTAGVFAPGQTHIFLVGLRASGKSTLGRRLARHLEMDFVDTDDLVVSRAGRSIAEIVQTDGWEAFRILESEALRDVCSRRGHVVATGGGIILDPDNQRLIQESGTTFYLMAEIPTLLARLSAAPGTDDQRPRLTDSPLEQELIQSNSQRGPIYMNLADHILRTEGHVDDTLRDALEKLGVPPRQ